jgi:hypothetical protein
VSSRPSCAARRRARESVICISPISGQFISCRLQSRRARNATSRNPGHGFAATAATAPPLWSRLPDRHRGRRRRSSPST